MIYRILPILLFWYLIGLGGMMSAWVLSKQDLTLKWLGKILSCGVFGLIVWVWLFLFREDAVIIKRATKRPKS